MTGAIAHIAQVDETGHTRRVGMVGADEDVGVVGIVVAESAAAAVPRTGRTSSL